MFQVQKAWPRWLCLAAAPWASIYDTCSVVQQVLCAPRGDGVPCACLVLLLAFPGLLVRC